MKKFNRFYLWGRNMKYRMGLYAAAVIFFKALVNALMGEYSVDSLTLLEMLLASAVFACGETAIFPSGKEWGVTSWRAALWAAVANGVYIGGALLFDWFRGIPVWGGVVLAAVLEAGLAATWYALWLDTQRDTENLNQSLKKFQRE